MGKLIKYPFKTNYYDAIKYLNIDYILCNNIEDIDKYSVSNHFTEMNSELFENEEYYPEVYQWYLTNADKYDVQRAKDTFDSVYFSYSDILDLYVLAVTHFGTMWKDVSVFSNKEISIYR